MKLLQCGKCQRHVWLPDYVDELGFLRCPYHAESYELIPIHEDKGRTEETDAAMLRRLRERTGARFIQRLSALLDTLDEIEALSKPDGNKGIPEDVVKKRWAVATERMVEANADVTALAAALSHLPRDRGGQ
jgi:hypothetical protein